MRASRKAKVNGQWSMVKSSKKVKFQNSNVGEIHISGAEGLYRLPEINKIARNFFLRAMDHPRGNPDKVVITVEKIKQKPIVVPLLPVSPMSCGSPDNALRIIGELLSDAGISRSAISKGIKVATGRAVMHGAALISSESAMRKEPDNMRGVRVSRLGIEKDTKSRLHKRLATMGINTPTVQEAIILASKVASCKDVVAELCISDDPDYTTGYIASKKLGYVRIPNIKRKGSSSGGRAFFVREGGDIKRIVEYLEKRPVIISSPSSKTSP